MYPIPNTGVGFCCPTLIFSQYYLDSSNKFIEIYNYGREPVDLRQLDLRLGRLYCDVCVCVEIFDCRRVGKWISSSLRSKPQSNIKCSTFWCSNCSGLGVPCVWHPCFCVSICNGKFNNIFDFWWRWQHHFDELWQSNSLFLRHYLDLLVDSFFERFVCTTTRRRLPSHLLQRRFCRNVG